VSRTAVDGRDQLAIKTMQMLSVDAVEAARSGHPGMPMGAAAMAYILWSHFLRFDPTVPTWPDRDRFVLSAGHGSMLLYSLLHLTGYSLSLEELRQFRQLGSRTPGHPEYGTTPGVEITTGPLGQGFAAAVGMALAERWLRSHFNRPDHTIIDHYVYGICSDGDLMEGISSEAASFAGHQRLGRLIFLYDDNRISIDGSTDLTFTEDVGQRFEAYGWHVQRVNGYDLDGIATCLQEARGEADRPSLIIARTELAHGSPNKCNKAEAHGAPLGTDEVRLTKKALKWPLKPDFYVPAEVRHHFGRIGRRGTKLRKEWEASFQAYREAHPRLGKRLQAFLNGELPPTWEKALPAFGPDDGPLATRKASGKVLNALASAIPNLIGGSGDLSESNNTYLEGVEPIQANTPDGRNIHFGVREHVMGGILNGLYLHGGIIPYAGTFLVFSDYMRASIRMAAIMKLGVVYVFTHDSIGVGEDGPTHQPVEQLAALRSIPHLVVIRPADAAETVVAWRVALKEKMPVALILTRQSLPVLDRSRLGSPEDLERGAYILKDPSQGEPHLLLVATGSEVAPTLEAHRMLSERGIRARLINMPSWELFERQPREYREHIFPPQVTVRLAVEAGVEQGWHRWVGPRGDVICMDRFGMSAPGGQVMREFGFDPAHIADRAAALVRG
jgi:transketolase